MDIYKKVVLERLTQVVSALDRNRSSFSFGCLDRNFWHYKIVDTPSARFQEGALILALIYLDQETPYFQKEEVRKWIKAALRFWLKIQARDGSFNEWYPYEKSFVATAFSGYAISETLILLPDIEAREEIIVGLKKAGDWLIGKRDKQAFNQNAGSLAALYNIFLLTKEEKYREECQKLVNFLKENQNEEGWFLEYGGADIGYLSLTIDYLARYYLKSKDEKVFPILEKGLFFLSNFIHPDGSAGGIYGSRNTTYLIPSGIEILAEFLPLARKISCTLRKSIENNQIVSLKNLDSRYLIQNGYAYLEASRQIKPQNNIEENLKLPAFIFGQNYFPQAGLWLKSAPNFYFIVNCKKGGVFYLYNRANGSGAYNSGLLLKKGSKKYISGCLCQENKIVFSKGEKTIIIKGKLKESKDFQPTALRFFGMRVLLKIGQFLPYFTIILKSFLRKLLISQKGSSPFYFERIFKIAQDLSVQDSFPAGRFEKGESGGILELVYTPSSRFFFPQLIFSQERKITKEELEQGRLILSKILL